MKTVPEDSLGKYSTEMAETSAQALPEPTDHEADQFGIHPVRRPTNIENDVNSLGQKKRVSGILTSPYFKEELESVVTDLLRSGHGGGDVIANEIANFFSPGNQRFHQGSSLMGMKTGIGCVSPINDLSVADASMYSKAEKLLRCKLAALYRIVDLFGWSNTIFNHITVRLSQEQEHFLINPFGLLYHEISASKLLKINMQGDVLDSGSTTLGYNSAGYTLHSAIHASRPDLHCVIHVHGSDVVAVSAMQCGLLPISQEALIVGEVSYHSYQGIVVDAKEKKSIQKHLGPKNKVMFLRNHGLVACGETVEEAFHYLYFTMLACNAQVKAMSCMGHDKLIQLDRSAMKSRTADVARKDVTGGVESVQWGPGEMLFEAHVRMLDDMGYRSGYSYKNSVIMQRRPRARGSVEIPPTVVSSENIEEMRSLLKRAEHSRWVNSPNQYTRILESAEDERGSSTSSQNGDASPKTRTKWKRSEDGKATMSSSVHITSPNQFVPTNTNPREVLETRRSIRGQGRWDVNRPGPQSQLLHSVSPDRNAQGGQVSTSSKGIIEKGHDVLVVPPAGPPNPFNAVSEDELKKYQKDLLEDVSQLNKEPGADETTPTGELDRTTEPKQEGCELSETSNGSEPPKYAANQEPEQTVQGDDVTSNGDASQAEKPDPVAASEIPAVVEEVKQPVASGPEEVKSDADDKEVAMRSSGSPEVVKKESGKKNKKRRSLSFLKKKKQKE